MKIDRSLERLIAGAAEQVWPVVDDVLALGHGEMERKARKDRKKNWPQRHRDTELLGSTASQGVFVASCSSQREGTDQFESVREKLRTPAKRVGERL